MDKRFKDIFIKDVCARLPYGVKFSGSGSAHELVGIHPKNRFPIELENGEYMPIDYDIEEVKPYLRPMSSMTAEEREEYESTLIKLPVSEWKQYEIESIDSFDFLHRNHFDHRGLIYMGLALEAPEGMYNHKNGVKPINS